MSKSRSGSRGNPATPPSPPQTIEAVRRRARHRLIGAVVLVALGVLGFPVLFDTQPRPISVDIPIEIPAKNPIAPLQPAPAPLPATAPAAPVAAEPAAAALPAPVAPSPLPAVASPSPAAPDVAVAQPTAPAAPAVAAAAPSVSTRDSLSAREEVVPATPPKPTPPKPEPAQAPKPDATPTQATEAARAQALLDGQPVATVRIVVQVGAFADPVRAQEVRLKLERAGLKTYTHVAQTPDGPRTRVRLGPFASRVEAEQAAERVKTLGLPAAILTL
jgi:DedD protein